MVECDPQLHKSAVSVRAGADGHEHVPAPNNIIANIIHRVAIVDPQVHPADKG